MYLLFHRWFLTLAHTNSRSPVWGYWLFVGGWQKENTLMLWIRFIFTLGGFRELYLPPWAGVCWASGHWTTLGSRPCSRTHRHHSTERPGWSATRLRPTPGPRAGTWRTSWSAQSHPRRGWFWSIGIWAPCLVPNRNSGRREFGRHTYRAESHCVQRGQWLQRCWKTLWRTANDQLRWYDAGCICN